MAQDNRKTEDSVESIPVVEGDESWKTEESGKIETHLITFPTALNFSDLPDKKKLGPKYSDSAEGPFGLGPLVFPCLQRFNNIKFYLTVYIFTIMAHGMLFALADMSLKVHEAHLVTSRSETFLMDFSDYFAAFLVSIFVAHFGGRGNRAKWVAAASMVTGLSAIVFAIPYFNYEIIKLNIVKEELCEEEKKPKACEATTIPHKSTCIYLFTLGQLLHGIAGMPLFLLGVTFILDHVPTHSSGLYLAIADAALALGYILGFVEGIQNFRIPVKEAMQAVGHVQRFRILQRSWFMSFIFAGAFAFCTTLPLFCFPSSLPGAHKIRLEKSQEPPSIDRRLKNKEIKPNLNSVLHAIWCLLRNPLVLTQIICKVLESMVFKASLRFLPQYLQTRFLLLPSRASSLSGAVLFTGGLIGRFIGGYIVDRLQMNNKNKLKFVVISSIVAIVLFLLTFFVECETAKFAGINDDYDRLGILGNLTAPCNEACGCTTDVYHPVCGRDDIQYFSPCFAGCRATKTIKNEKIYYNCSCIKEGLTTADREGHYIDAVSGTCDTRCLTLPMFFAFYFTATVFSSLCSIPAFLIIMQSVPPSWNTMSLGLTFAIWRFIGCIPGPLIFEATSDFTCNFWNINECGEKVRCWIYNKGNLVFTFKTIWLTMQVLACLLCLYALYRHDYIVKNKSKSLAMCVKGKKGGGERKKGGGGEGGEGVRGGEGEGEGEGEEEEEEEEEEEKKKKKKKKEEEEEKED